MTFGGEISNMHQKSETSVVVGGGIVGLLVAWYLSEAGERALIVEPNVVGAASWAGAGLLTPLYPENYSQIYSLWRGGVTEYERIIAAADSVSGEDSQLRRCTLLRLDKADSNPSNPSATWKAVSPAEVAAIEPALSVREGITSFPSAHVRSPRLLRSLRVYLETRGVKIFKGRVQQILISNDRFVGVTVEEQNLLFRRCFLATGAWTSSLVPLLRLPIRPIRGQMIGIAADPGILTSAIVDNYFYMVPRSDGLVIAGSTVEDVGFDSAITESVRRELHRAATSLVPALSAYPVSSHWAGLRPGSPDDRPFIGEHPGIEGLFVCAGHHRNGYAAGPMSARLVVDMALGRTTMTDPAPFRLTRDCKWPPKST